MIRIREEIYRLSPATLTAVAVSLREGPLSLGISGQGVRKLAGSEGEFLYDFIQELSKDGMAPRHIAVMLESIAKTMEASPDPAILFELVLSGPDLPGVPTEDTAATFQTLIQEAQQEILLVGYAVHGGERLFAPLAQRMKEKPNLRVHFFLDISRKLGDTSLDSEIVKRFAHEFRQKHWPWPELPELFYDPRGVAPSAEGKASLHAKCVVVDRKAALVTSANFTEAAQKRNIELGILIRYAPFPERIAIYFHGLRASGNLLECQLDNPSLKP